MTFTYVNGQLWGFYSNGIMPLPVPRAIVNTYKKTLTEHAKAIATVKDAFGQRFTYSYAQHSIDELERRIEQIQADQYVCPPGCWVCSYSVKKSYGIYYYYKIMATKPIFPARSTKNAGKMLKTLHLGAYDSLSEASRSGRLGG